MSKINLIPEVKLEKIKIKRLNFVFGFGSVVLGSIMALVILILLGYQLTRTQAISATEKKIDNTKEELASFSDLEKTVINIEKGLKSVEVVDKYRHNWSLFLPHLEKVTPNDVRFVEFNQEGNSFEAKAEGRSVNSIARLIQSLENYKTKKDESSPEENLFGETTVNGYTKKLDGGVSFEVSFELKGGILW